MTLCGSLFLSECIDWRNWSWCHCYHFQRHWGATKHACKNHKERQKWKYKQPLGTCGNLDVHECCPELRFENRETPAGDETWIGLVFTSLLCPARGARLCYAGFDVSVAQLFIVCVLRCLEIVTFWCSLKHLEESSILVSSVTLCHQPRAKETFTVIECCLQELTTSIAGLYN